MPWISASARGAWFAGRARVARPIALAALLMACGGTRHAETRADAPPLALLAGERAYLVLYRPAARWPKGAPLPEQPVREHSRYLLSLYRVGTLKFAGRFADGSGGAMFFAARDDAAALRLIMADPAVVAQVFEFDLRPWQLADWQERDKTWPK
jgi:uncharacterized protein YciI